MAELRQIIASKNDNDPRLDADFNGLTADEKAAFRAEYKAIPRELVNERGTIVFLLGKNIRAADDWAFMTVVAGEPRCWSLADCGRKPTGDGDDESGDAVTLAYPSLVALKQAQRFLEAPSAADAANTTGARAVVEAGKKSDAPAANRLATTISRRFHRRRRQ